MRQATTSTTKRNREQLKKEATSFKQLQTDREWAVRTKARDRQEFLQQKNKLVQYEKMQEAKEKRKLENSRKLEAETVKVAKQK